MNLAILGTRGIPARYGGFETFAEKLAVGLFQRGHDVTVYCEEGSAIGTASAKPPAEYRGVKLRYCPAPKLGPLQTVIFDINCLWDARNEFDIVYMLGYGAAPFCYIPRLLGTEVWINPDGIEWARAKWNGIAKLYFRIMEWFSVRIADRVIADSDEIAQHLTARHGNIPSCSVIRYGCDVIDFAPSPRGLAEWQLKPDDYYLVVCRLEPENHVLEILEGFRRSKSARKMVVVGDCNCQARYVKELRNIRDERIRMIGSIYDQSKLTCLRYHAYAYIHGHSVGGTNPSLLEAMGCGNLIFAHDNRFNRETLASAGIYFRLPETLSRMIEEAERHEYVMDRQRDAAKERARTLYRWSDIVGRYAALMDRTEERRKAA